MFWPTDLHKGNWYIRVGFIPLSGRFSAHFKGNASLIAARYGNAGVSYRAETMPLVFWVEYTRSVEQGARAQPNDRVEAAMQVTFR